MLGALFIISGVHWKILTVVIGLIAALGAILLLLVFTEWGNRVLFRLHFSQYQLDRVRAWADPSVPRLYRVPTSSQYVGDWLRRLIGSA